MASFIKKIGDLIVEYFNTSVVTPVYKHPYMFKSIMIDIMNILSTITYGWKYCESIFDGDSESKRYFFERINKKYNGKLYRFVERKDHLYDDYDFYALFDINAEDILYELELDDEALGCEYIINPGIWINRNDTLYMVIFEFLDEELLVYRAQKKKDILIEDVYMIDVDEHGPEVKFCIVS